MEAERKSWAEKPKEQRQQRGAAITANAKIKKQFESKSKAFQRRKIQAATKKLNRKQRYGLNPVSNLKIPSKYFIKMI